MSNDDRDRTDEGHLMTGNWTDEDMAKVAAEELGTALRKQNIGSAEVTDDDDRVAIDFRSLAEAELMLLLLFRQPAGPNTMYDRATSGCVTVSALADRYGADAPAGALQAAFEAGWRWDVHPAMSDGRALGWHTSVTLSADDAMTAAALLNSGDTL